MIIIIWFYFAQISRNTVTNLFGCYSVCLFPLKANKSKAQEYLNIAKSNMLKLNLNLNSRVRNWHRNWSAFVRHQFLCWLHNRFDLKIDLESLAR